MLRSAATTTFRWNGTDRVGRRIKGVTVAAGEPALRAELWRQGIVPSRIRRALLTGGGRIKAEEITAMTRQLATMTAAGIPLVQAFDIIANSQDSPALQGLMLKVKGDIEGGAALASALARHPWHFDDLYVNLVAAGEQSGALEGLLEKIAAYREKTQTIRYRVRKALLYPAAVTAVAFVVTTILLVFVIPQFEALFAGFGAELPALTRLVIELSDFVRRLRLGARTRDGSLRDGIRARQQTSPPRTASTGPLAAACSDHWFHRRHGRHRTICTNAGNHPLRPGRPLSKAPGVGGRSNWK